MRASPPTKAFANRKINYNLNSVDIDNAAEKQQEVSYEAIQ